MYYSILNTARHYDETKNIFKLYYTVRLEHSILEKYEIDISKKFFSDRFCFKENIMV
jgi:hypothetical protein